jgi:hypothetical protein
MNDVATETLRAASPRPLGGSEDGSAARIERSASPSGPDFSTADNGR